MKRNQGFKKEKVRKKIKKISHMKDIDYSFLCGIMLLLFIGVVMVYSSSSYYALYENESSEFFIIKELIWTVVGIIAMFFTMSFDYHNYKKLTPLVLIIAFISLVAVLFFGSVNGAVRWIRLGPLSFQPSELGKYTVVLYLAYAIDNGKNRIEKFWSGTTSYLIIPGLIALLVLLEQNLSITVIIAVVSMIMVIAGGAKIKYILSLIPLGFAGVGALIAMKPYRLKRFTTFLNPWEAHSDDSYQLIQSFYALSSGGIFGVGLGNSRQKALFMPEPHNDFIFAIIGEELGLIGAVFVVFLFILITVKGAGIAIKAKDNYGYLLGMGIISIIAIQAVINIAVVTGSMPVTGVPLPLISYGGTSLVFNLTALGILLNISRQSKEVLK
ncbi:putative lipid II flippase FtsW [Clostridium sp.]|uniref:putative lipid II flippase FtsW n=1 Tax=Clostridium sp. TaxID=1506 RepID=UPI002604E2E9|nr:putative lipid II flippase FtsW [Clostridium sp.]